MKKPRSRISHFATILWSVFGLVMIFCGVVFFVRSNPPQNIAPTDSYIPETTFFSEKSFGARVGVLKDWQVTSSHKNPAPARYELEIHISTNERLLANITATVPPIPTDPCTTIGEITDISAERVPDFSAVRPVNFVAFISKKTDTTRVLYGIMSDTQLEILRADSNGTCAELSAPVWDIEMPIPTYAGIGTGNVRVAGEFLAKNNKEAKAYLAGNQIRYIKSAMASLQFLP